MLSHTGVSHRRNQPIRGQLGGRTNQRPVQCPMCNVTIKVGLKCILKETSCDSLNISSKPGITGI